MVIIPCPKLEAATLVGAVGVPTVIGPGAMPAGLLPDVPLATTVNVYEVPFDRPVRVDVVVVPVTTQYMTAVSP